MTPETRRERFQGQRMCSECGEWAERKAAWVESPSPGGVLYYWECRDEECAHTVPDVGAA